MSRASSAGLDRADGAEVPGGGGRGGEPTIRGTRLSVWFILACLTEGMSYEDIVREYSDFPHDSLAEVLRFAAEVTDRSDVAA